jgi:excisionase family DNA binding protein
MSNGNPIVLVVGRKALTLRDLIHPQSGVPVAGARSPGEGKAFLTVREVAQLLKIPENRVYDLAARGQIPCVHIGERQLRFIREDLLAWARNGGSQVKPGWPTPPNIPNRKAVRGSAPQDPKGRRGER